jgi:sucrose-6-phosphate hydrolase SacC (GH32 family)
MAESKEQLLTIIRDWVKIDNELRTLQSEVNKRKADKKKASVSLMDIMKKNSIDVFDINDGQLCYTKRNIKKPITKKALMDILATYYKGDLVKAEELNEFILDNREEVIKETIERKIAK